MQDETLMGSAKNSEILQPSYRQRFSPLCGEKQLSPRPKVRLQRKTSLTDVRARAHCTATTKHPRVFLTRICSTNASEKICRN